MKKAFIFACSLLTNSISYAAMENQDLFEKQSLFMYDRILDNVNDTVLDSVAKQQRDFDKYFSISKEEFQSQNYSSSITFSNKAIRSLKNIADLKLEILRFQLGISYAKIDYNKAAVKNLINYLRIVSLKEQPDEKRLIKAIDLLLKKADIISEGDQLRISTLVSPIMQMKISKDTYAGILLLISQLEKLDISIIKRWEQEYITEDIDEDVRNEFYISYAKQLVKKSEYQNAKKILRKHIPTTNMSAASIYFLYLARLENKLGKPYQSIKYYKKIKEIDGLYPVSSYEIIFVYEQIGDIKLAIKKSKEYLVEFRESKNAPYIRRYLSNLYLKSNNVKEAKEITSISISQIEDILERQNLLKEEFKDKFEFPSQYNDKVISFIGTNPTIEQYLKNQKNLTSQSEELAKLMFSFNNYITQIQSSKYQDKTAENSVNLKRKILEKLIINANEIITRKLDLISENISEKNSLQLKAIDERIDFFNSEKYKQSINHRNWEDWYDLVTTEKNIFKAINYYYEALAYDAELRFNENLNPLPLNQNLDRMNKKLIELSKLLIEVKKEKLSYKLMQNGTYGLKQYASFMISAIVEKKLALDSYQGPDNNMLVQTRIERLNSLWTYWLDTSSKFLNFLIQDQKKLVEELRKEIHHIEKINLALTSTRDDIRQQGKTNEETLARNMEKIFADQEFYLQKLQSHYRKWNIDADLIGINDQKKKIIKENYEAKSQYNRERSYNVDLGVF